MRDRYPNSFENVMIWICPKHNEFTTGVDLWSISNLTRSASKCKMRSHCSEILRISFIRSAFLCLFEIQTYLPKPSDRQQ